MRKRAREGKRIEGRKKEVRGAEFQKDGATGTTVTPLGVEKSTVGLSQNFPLR